jgi:predicted RNA binding protein YcfA (HicA-like mRNA interferase family)
MKLRDFLRELTKAGCVFVRPGGRHDLWMNPKNGRKAAVPRHVEVKNTTAAQIVKDLGI